MPAPKKPSDKPATKKVIDVSAPGKSAPDSTSRPVIVSHRPMIEDPMVSKTSSDTPSAPPLASRGKTLVPLAGGAVDTSDSESKDVAKPPSQVKKISLKPDTTDEEKPEASPKEPAKQPESTEAKQAQAPEASVTLKAPEETPPPEDTATKPDSAEKLNENEGDVPGTTKAAEERKKAEAEAAKKAEADKYEKMIADKTYFAPIDTSVTSSGSKLANIMLFVLLLGLVGAILAIDAGLLDVGMELPFDLIKNQ